LEFQATAEKTAKNIREGYFFAAPCIYLNTKSNPHSNPSINSEFLYQIFLSRRTESAQTRKHDTGRWKPNSNRYNSAGRSGSTLACGARDPRFESRCGQKFVFSRKSLRYAAFGTACTLTVVSRSTQPSTLRGTVNENQRYG